MKTGPCGPNGLWFHIVWVPLCPFPFPVTRHQPGAALRWISMALIPLSSSPGAFHPVGLDGQKTPQAVVVSKSAALNPKHPHTRFLLQRWYRTSAISSDVSAMKKWRMTKWKCIWMIWRSCCPLDRAPLLSQQLHLKSSKLPFFKSYLSIYRSIRSLSRLRIWDLWEADEHSFSCVPNINLKLDRTFVFD